MRRLAALAWVPWLLCACGGGESGGEDANPPDTQAPRVLRTEPADLATGVAADAVVRVFFDEAYDNTRISDDQIGLARGGQPLYGNLSRDTAQFSLSLRLSVPFEAGVTYEATLARGVCDLAPAQNCTQAPTTWSFTVAP